MAPYLLRSAVAILRRPTFLRRSPIDSSRFFASGAAARVDPAKAGCVASMCMGTELKKLAAANARQMRETAAIMQEQEERFQRHEQFQKRLSYVLVPSAIAFFIFGPDKKRVPLPDGQLGI